MDEGEKMIDYKIKIGLIPDVRDLGDFDTRKGMFEPAKGKERKDKAIKYIKDHYSEPIKLDDLCKASFISKQMIIRYFNKHLGKSPLVYITEYKIDLIKSLLLELSHIVLIVSI